MLDCWRVLPEQVAGAIEHYLTLGKGGRPGYFSEAAGSEKLPRSIDPPIERAGWSGYNRIALSSIMTSVTDTITQVQRVLEFASVQHPAFDETGRHQGILR